MKDMKKFVVNNLMLIVGILLLIVGNIICYYSNGRVLKTSTNVLLFVLTFVGLINKK